MRKIAVVAAALGGLFVGAPAALGAPTAEERAAAAEAEKRGGAMFAYDQAAWHATDKFQEDIRRRGLSPADLQDRGARGYVVEPGENGRLQVTFYGERDGRRFAIARYETVDGRVRGGGFIEPDAAPDISLLAQRMIDARDQALVAMSRPDHSLCSQSPPNTLVLPPQGDGKMLVYVLTSATAANTYPAGGHYRFDFDADGKLRNERRFMQSCFDLDYRTSPQGRPEALFLTHLLDPQPTEIHAFVSRNVPVPLMVATVANGAIWGVANGRIQYVSDIPAGN